MIYKMLIIKMNCVYIKYINKSNKESIRIIIIARELINIFNHVIVHNNLLCFISKAFSNDIRLS